MRVHPALLAALCLPHLRQPRPNRRTPTRPSPQAQARSPCRAFQTLSSSTASSTPASAWLKTSPRPCRPWPSPAARSSPSAPTTTSPASPALTPGCATSTPPTPALHLSRLQRRPHPPRLAPANIKLNVDLTGVKSLADMLAKIQAFAQAAPAGHWLTGGNWDHTLWPSKTLPTRQDLDKVTARPSRLSRPHRRPHRHRQLRRPRRRRHHRQNQPPQGGAIDLDASGEPTGILRESAQGLV